MKYKEIIKWWEDKRKLYNIILISTSIFVLFASDFKSVLNEIFAYFFILLVGFFFANIFYCLGAGLDASSKYLGYNFSNTTRFFYYTLGLFVSIFSVLLTVIF